MSQRTADLCGMSSWADLQAWGNPPSRTAGKPNADLLMQVGQARHFATNSSFTSCSRTLACTCSSNPIRITQSLPLMLQLATELEDHHGADAREANHVAIMSLREVMIRGLLKEWKTRLQAFQANDEARNTATRLQWLDSLGHWNHMHCCPAKQHLVLTEKTESQSTERGTHQDQRVGDAGHRATPSRTSSPSASSGSLTKRNGCNSCSRFRSEDQETDCGLFSPSSSAVQRSTSWLQGYVGIAARSRAWRRASKLSSGKVRAST